LISGVSIIIFLFLVWVTSKVTNLVVAQNWRSKSARVGSIMVMLIRVQMPVLVITMLIRWWKELNMVEGNTYSCFCPTWKPTSCAMATKVLWITSWVLVHLLLWVQHKRWISIRLMGCVHTHWGILAIEGWGGSSRIQSVIKIMRKIIERLKRLVELQAKHPPLG